MAFRNIVCWNIDRVRDVMNTNAELAQRDIFLAVHSEYPLTICNPGIGDLESAPRWTKDPHQFLQEFLSPDQRHVQVAVLGNSGSGKSHFIRWMSLNIPVDRTRHVISVPRAGISLRGVIDMILAALPDEQARPYQEQLDQAGFQRATPADLQDRLISAIAHAIREDEPHLDEDQDLEAAFIEELPNLFHDPALRSYYKKTGGLVEQLVNQVLSASPTYTPVQERRSFALDDLPLTVIQPRDLSEPTRRTIDSLRADDESQQLAVEIINRNLDRAIRQMMNFTGDRLVQLFADVRKYLRSQGQELVLLVEDLARLQGLDLALLDALIEEGTEENGLCVLRWAAAVTTGYYAPLADTVKTRMTFVVDMDLSKEGNEPIIDDDTLVNFAARYMNAVRLAPDLLDDWAVVPDDERGAPPIACDSCEYQSTCHEAFGSEQGIGLYPLNRQAILNMLRRVDPQFDRRFNPRLLVKEVLAEIFGTYGRDLLQGQFPSGSILDQMGGQKLPPVVITEIRQQDTENAARQIALTEMWGVEATALIDLPEDLYSAFALMKPTVDLQAKKQRVEEPKIREQKSEQREDPYVEAIHSWSNGQRMLDDLANRLRPLVYDSIVGRIDWDNQGLVQTEFAQATGGHFPRVAITFVDQQTISLPRSVGIRIPLNEEPADRELAAMALEGLYLFGQHGNWNFPNGSSLFATLANMLDEWCAHVVTQLKHLPDSESDWDTAGSAIELLAIGATLGGQPTRASATLPDFLNALFDEWPQEISAQSQGWRSLYEAIHREQERLRNLALARATGSKGGVRGAFIDPSKVLPPLRHVRRRWELDHPPPDGMVNRRDDYGVLAKLHNRISAELPTAVAAEWHRRIDWVDEWRESVPEGIGRKEVVDSVRELVELGVKYGVPFDRRIREAILAALTELERIQLDDSLKTATALRQIEDPLRQLPELGRDRGANAMAAVAVFLPAIHDLLDDLEASVATRLADRGQGEMDLREHQAQIRKSLEQLSRDLDVLGGRDADSD